MLKPHAICSSLLLIIKAENAALKQQNAELDARITALEQAMQQLMGQQARRINAQLSQR